MEKTKTTKIAAVAVSVVLAGTLALSLTACGKNKDSKETVKYVNMAYPSTTTLNVAIGYSNSDTGMFYGASVGTGHTFAGGYSANANGAKPATRAIMDALKLNLSNAYGGVSTSSNLTQLVNDNKWGSTVDMATSDLSVAATEAAKGTVLNLADYLQYMPNFANFLSENPIVYLSVLQGGMNTTTGEGEDLYVAPYFDGMDDIEKGVLMRQDWIEDVLDRDWSSAGRGGLGTDSQGNQNASATDDTYKTACYSIDDSGKEKTEATETYAESFMGTSGSWDIVSTAEPDSFDDETGDPVWASNETITITKNYKAALDAVTSSETTALKTAYQAIAGASAAYSSTGSGNIVDIMSDAITQDLKSGGTEATGENLATLYKAYIATAYTVGEEQYYGTENVPYSKVFTGYSACWDVDDLVALLRIIKCSSGQVGLDASEKTVGIYPRDYTNSRTPDIISLVGELYGRRGATSRYENTYIDSKGVLQDARADVEFWEALERFGQLADEGLVEYGYVKNQVYNSQSSTYLDDLHGTSSSNGVGFMQWDYSQTQTTQLFNGIMDAGDERESDANYGWVNTPVSIWDDGTTSSTTGQTYSYSYATKGTSGAEATGKYMRFTDSWRSTKTAGLVLAGSLADKGNEDKLAAALAFVDFLYSNDGQITTTYAIQDTTNNGTSPNGTWYGTPIADVTSIDSDATDYTDVCDETYQWVIKEEYRDKYVVNNGLVSFLETGEPAYIVTETNEKGNIVSTEDISTQLETYAEKTSYYSVKAEYESQCFTFGGELYTGTLYKGKMTPTITDELYYNFTHSTSEECKIYTGTLTNFTNFARYILGSTLPICVKDQSFENQMTAQIAKDDATRVSVSIGNDTINHCQLEITENRFYTCVPTGFPLENNYQQVLDNAGQDMLKYETGTAYGGNSAFWSMYHWIIWFGYSGKYGYNGCNLNLSTIGNASGMVSHLQSIGLTTRIETLRIGWTTAQAYWDYLGK